MQQVQKRYHGPHVRQFDTLAKMRKLDTVDFDHF